MTSFTDVFTGSPISPGEVSYRAFSIAVDTTLSANDRSTSTNGAARVMDVTATVGSLTLRLPAANLLASGFAYIITNVGSNTFTVAGNGGAVLATVDAGEQWQFYVTSNTTAAGAWRSVQFGAGTSSASAGALAGAGLKAEGALLSVKQEVSTFNSSTTAGTGDRGKVLTWTGGSGTLDLPAAGTVGADWVAGLKNAGSGTLAITPASGTIDGTSSVQLAPTESTYVVTDGTNYYTVGAGRSSSFSFTYLAIAVAGTGTYTLSAVEQNKTSYKFTGILTGNRTIVVPTTVQQYWIDNATSGAFTLTVKTSAGAGVAVTQGQRAILYCDGTDVLDADTAGISTPIAIADGGTGATTASAARTNLGATSVGGALFTAASASAARSTLGSSVTGDALFITASASAARTTLGASVVGDALFITASASAARTTLGATAIGSTIFMAADAAAVRTAISVPVSTTTISAGTGLTGGGDLSANRTITLVAFTGDSGAGGAIGGVPAPSAGDAAAAKYLSAGGGWSVPSAGVTYATSSQVNAYSSTTTVLSPGNVFAAIAETTLVPSVNTITPDLTTFTNGAYTLTTGQALTLANPSAVVAGKQHRIRLAQPSSGSVGTITFGSNYKKAAADSSALTASLSAVDYIYLDVRSSTEILYSFKRQVA